MNERYQLAKERIEEIVTEERAGDFSPFFTCVAGWITETLEYTSLCKKNLPTSVGQTKDGISLDVLIEKQKSLYKDVLPENYETSYLNPAHSSKCFGCGMGRYLSFLYEEVRCMTGFLFEGKEEEVLIRMELFLEVYSAFVYSFEEEHKAPNDESIHDILYWYVSDYSEMSEISRTEEVYAPKEELALDIIRQCDLNDPWYLFLFGEYISDSELKASRYLAKLPDETIARMADTFTEGFRKGFEAYGKDMTIKETVNIIYPLGHEKMIRKTVENFEQMGLHPVIYRACGDIFRKKGLDKIGFMSTSPNRQKDYDHREDMALFLDGHLVTRFLEARKKALDAYKSEIRLMAGPAYFDSFGEADFTPVSKEEAPHFDEAGEKLWVELKKKTAEQAKGYIHREERSFTIIAFPIPEIGENYPEILDEVIRINTLDSNLYRNIQACIIDALNQADYVHILGKDGNETELTVNLCKLKNPERETIFENCVADVNIPVGEVFTSPVLKGTNGLLHVKKVYINGLAYENLKIRFEDGITKEYSCSNLPDSVIAENILYHHAFLPMGEFAIGTNTTAFAAARRLAIEDKLPILIAEKTGPHFAVGDTCYSHEEDIRVYNPDGKEIVAKENTYSEKRLENPLEAYFECHTDITVPYEEIGHIEAVRKDGSRIEILKNGRFVLPGTEALNEPLKNL